MATPDEKVHVARDRGPPTIQIVGSLAKTQEWWEWENSLPCPLAHNGCSARFPIPSDWKDMPWWMRQTWDRRDPEIVKHYATCVYKYDYCKEFQCNESHLKLDMAVHVAICREKMVVCRSCRSEFKRGDANQVHATKVCLDQSVSCVNMCGKNIKRRDMETHIISCFRRPIACLHCCQTVPIMEYSKHLDTCKTLKFVLT